MMEFMALLAGHTPSPYESLVYYYGLYSSSHRGKEKKENIDEEVEVEKVGGIGKASSTWARLIRKVFEVDILKCRKCGGGMRVIAFVSDFQETEKILKHIGEETVRPLPLNPKPTETRPPDSEFGDYIPPVEVYVQDPEYAY